MERRPPGRGGAVDKGKTIEASDGGKEENMSGGLYVAVALM